MFGNDCPRELIPKRRLPQAVPRHRCGTIGTMTKYVEAALLVIAAFGAPLLQRSHELGLMK
jgi:hypothetical protein